jgi:hypothetical protein
LLEAKVRIPQTFDIDAAWQAAFDGCLDEKWSKKRKRKRQIHLVDRASFLVCQLLGVSD